MIYGRGSLVQRFVMRTFLSVALRVVLLWFSTASQFISVFIGCLSGRRNSRGVLGLRPVATGLHRRERVLQKVPGTLTGLHSALDRQG